MARRAKPAGEELLVEGLRGVVDQIEGLIETFEIVSDRRFVTEVKAGLREAKRDKGRSIKGTLADLSGA